MQLRVLLSMMASLPAFNLLFATALLLPSLEVVASFKDGDFIHTSRKAQFHQQRTQWHDLLGHHCPRFGQNRLVAVPLPKPQQDLTPSDDYKIQLSLDGGRHLTPWLLILGKRAPEVPVVTTTIKRSGEEILGVSAKVEDAPTQFKQEHASLLKEFNNTAAWPKHLLIYYTFKTENDVDLDRGLQLLFGIGLLITLILLVNAVRGMQPKLQQFLQEMVVEDAAGTSSTWKEVAKAE